MAREHEIRELSEFLGKRTGLRLSVADEIAEVVIDAGWRRPSDAWIAEQDEGPVRTDIGGK